VSFRWTAYCDGRPRLTTQVKWYATDKMRPAEAQGRGDDFWLVEIDGRPAVRMFIELSGTLNGDREHPDNPSHVSMLATAVPALQAIPDVIAAEPGVLIAGGPRFHWKEYGVERLAATR
jgi:2,4-diaminopentanoate dehydrogenase